MLWAILIPVAYIAQSGWNDGEATAKLEFQQENDFLQENIKNVMFQTLMKHSVLLECFSDRNQPYNFYFILMRARLKSW